MSSIETVGSKAPGLASCSLVPHEAVNEETDDRELTGDEIASSGQPEQALPPCKEDLGDKCQSSDGYDIITQECLDCLQKNYKLRLGGMCLAVVNASIECKAESAEISTTSLRYLRTRGIAMYCSPDSYDKIPAAVIEFLKKGQKGVKEISFVIEEPEPCAEDEEPSLEVVREQPRPGVTREQRIFNELVEEKKINQVDPFHALNTFVYPECYDQKELRYVLRGSHRIIVIEGPEKSGKTHLISACFLEYVRRNPDKKAILVQGKQFKEWSHDASGYGSNGSKFRGLEPEDFKRFFEQFDGIFIDGVGQLAEGSSKALKNWLQDEWRGKTVVISGASANGFLFTEDGKLKVPEGSALKHIPLPRLSQKRERVDRTLALLNAVPMEDAGEYDDTVNSIEHSLREFLDKKTVPSGKIFSSQAFINNLVDKIKLLQEARERSLSQFAVHWDERGRGEVVEEYYQPKTLLKCFEHAWKMSLMSKPKEPGAESAEKKNGSKDTTPKTQEKKPKANAASAQASKPARGSSVQLGSATQELVESLNPKKNGGVPQ